MSLFISLVCTTGDSCFRPEPSQHLGLNGPFIRLRPPLQKARLKLIVADQKSIIQGRGIAQVRVQIGQLEFAWPVYVAPIADHLLLGCDVMDAIDLQVSPRRGLWVKDHWLPCQVSRTPYGPKPATVTLQKATLLPANHEVVALGKTPRDSETPGQEAIFEPVPHGMDGLLAARALVRVDDALPLRLINVSSQPLELPAGFVIGELQWVAGKEVPTNSEGPKVRVTSLVMQGDRQAGEDGSSERARDSDPAIPGEASPEDLPEHLQDLYQQTAEHIDSPALRMQLAGVLLRRQAAFAQSRLDLGTFSAIKHMIDTGCGAAVWERVRRTPRGFEEEEERCLREQLESGVIRPSSSAWAAPTVLVRKADGSVRFCIDYRGLNSRTIKDAYPLPRIDMCFDCLGDMSYFSTVDLQSGYWQVQVEETDIHKTAFITKYGLFECIKMPFGLCSAPSTFQRCMELVFPGLQWRTLLIYLDDIIILGRTMEENLERLDEALGRLQAANLKLKPSKCKLLQREVLFLGHIVSSEGARPNPKLVEAVCQWSPPQDRQGVQQFLGLCNYYRRFVPNFSAIASPLTELTSKSVMFRWTEAANLAFVTLKTALTTAPVLSFPLPSGEYLLDTDVSDLVVGGVLSQVQDGEEKVIAYSSKKLNKQQRRYCVTRRELLVVVTFLREFRNYLLAQEFVIRTDHNSLTWLLRFKEPQGQLARWLEYVFQFRFQIVHRHGKKHGNADALSREPSAAEGDSCDEYRTGVPLESLPCGGCKYCAKRHEEWADFQENVDDVVPLVTGGGACWKVTTRSQAQRRAKREINLAPLPEMVTSVHPGFQATPRLSWQRPRSATLSWGLYTVGWVPKNAPAKTRQLVCVLLQGHIGWTSTICFSRMTYFTFSGWEMMQDQVHCGCWFPEVSSQRSWRRVTIPCLQPTLDFFLVYQADVSIFYTSNLYWWGKGWPVDGLPFPDTGCPVPDVSIYYMSNINELPDGILFHWFCKCTPP